MTQANELAELLENPSPENVRLLCKGLFDVWLTEGQAEIVYRMVFGGKRFSFVCPTRYGKTYAIAAGLALYVTLHSGKTVTILSNKQANCEKIRDRFIEHAVNCPDLMRLLDSKSSGVKGLKEEISKKEIKLRDGTHIQMQAAGANVKPDSLDGLGGDLIVLDESDNVPDSNFQKGVRRMAGDNPDTRLVQSGNATLRNKHFFESFKSDRYDSYRIDWEQAVNERYGPDGERPLTRDFVLGEKEELPPSHFKSMYECRFPESDESSLIDWSDLEAVRSKELPAEFNVTPIGDDVSQYPYVLYGLDVAREGRDHSVLTRVLRFRTGYVVTGQWVWDMSDTNQLSNTVIDTINNVDGDRYTRVNVDSHGIGAGVLDNLRAKGVYAAGVKVGVGGRKNLSRPDDFQDLKAEFYDKVRRIISEGDLWFDGEFKRLVKELDSLETEKNTRNKIRVVDPDKSPDFADSFMLAVSVDRGRSGNLEMGRAEVF